MGEEVVEVRYRGGVTVGSPGRAYLHNHDGGLAELIWEALGRAGRLGQTAQLHPLIGVFIEVAPVPVGAVLPGSRFVPRPGGLRREGEPGWVSDDGRICQSYEGPLPGRAAGPGVRLVESEWRVDELDGFEDLLYTAAVRAGWIRVANTPVIGEVPEVEVRVRVPPHER